MSTLREQIEALADEFTEWWLLPSTDPMGGKEVAGNLVGRLRALASPDRVEDDHKAAAIREAMDAGEAAWRSANWPTPEWGWDALPEDEREQWQP